jgi:predicted transcriptional regulator of viral defense system
MIRPLIPSQLPEHLLAEGRYWFTTSEAESLLERRREKLYPRLAEMERSGKLFSPAKGLYVVVPPDYRSWGVVPAGWFIDPMMRQLGREYYVSFLSAAARHGASHQAPQTFQVAVDRTLEDRDVKRVRLRFVKNRVVGEAAREDAQTQTGTFQLATKETTLVDLAWRPRLGGGISNVATILKELGEIDAQALARVAATRGRGTARRLGWLIERYRPDIETFWLRQVARPDDGTAAVLVPGNPPRGQVDRHWGLRLNGEVEPD